MVPLGAARQARCAAAGLRRVRPGHSALWAAVSVEAQFAVLLAGIVVMLSAERRASARARAAAGR